MKGNHMKENGIKELKRNEIIEISGGGPMGKLIGWIGRLMTKSSMVEMEQKGYMNPTW